MDLELAGKRAIVAGAEHVVEGVEDGPDGVAEAYAGPQQIGRTASAHGDSIACGRCLHECVIPQ